MAGPRRSRRSRSSSRPVSRRRSRPLARRKRDFQRWLFNLTLIVMAVLVIGFLISAITTRSGVPITITGDDLTDRSRLLTVPAGSLSREGPDSLFTEERIVIEVLNGCGIPGLAQDFGEYLRRQGFDVVRFTNAQRYDYPRTLVIARGSDFTRAQLVAQTLGVESRVVENMPDPSLQLDVTLVLGHDYRGLPVYRDVMAPRR